MEERSTPLRGNPEPDLPALQFPAGRPIRSSSDLSPSLLSKVWRGKWLLLASVLGFTLVALMLGAVRAPLYKAQTSIELQSPAYQRGPEAGPAASTDSYIETQIRIIQSRSLVERVVVTLSEAERSRLVESPRFGNGLSNDQNLESILKHLTASPSEQAGIVDIYFLCPDPVAGAHFLNSLTRELVDFNVERSWHAAQHSREWTDRQLNDLRRKWEQSEQLLAEYSQASGISLPKDGSDQAQAWLPATLSKVRVVRPHAASTPAVVEANDPKIRELKDHLADLDKQIAQWQALYGASTPTAASLKSQAAATETAIRQRRAALAQSLGPRTQTTPDEQPAPETVQPSPAITSRAEAFAHFDVLKQDADSNRRLYEATAARLKEANLATSSNIGDINVVDPAIPPTRSSTPSQLLNGSLGALAGLLLGLTFVTLGDRFSHTFAEPAMLSRFLGLDVLGAIPADRFQQPEKGFTDAADGPTLSLSFDTDAQTAEAYRSIRSSILLKAGQRSGPRKIVFTSAGASEGKTSVVGNLGAALASAQRRVLLVDGDLRNPGLHKIFGAENEHGLADLLGHQATAIPIATRDVIRETQVPDLYLLSAGQAAARAPEILSSVQLPQLLREFAKGFDIVLIDSPPVLPYADARSLARAADGVILIVKAGATDRRAALLARDAIAQDGAPFVGTILTNWDSSQSRSA